MNKEQVKAAIEKSLKPDEQLLGFFIAQKHPPFWYYLLLGPLAALALRGYLVGVTNKGIHFHKMNLMGKLSQHDIFAFDEIKTFKVGSGLIQLPLTFTFSNGQKLNIKAQKRGLDRIAKIDENTVAMIRQNIKAIE